MTKRPRKAANEQSDRRPLPRFGSEDEERAFWEKADSTDYVDWGRAARVRLPELKPSTATISLRLPETLLEELKALANERDVPYQSLLKIILAERLQEERRRRRSA
jgi:predicted DNA binding CopG/RHH family protein